MSKVKKQYCGAYNVLAILHNRTQQGVLTIFLPYRVACAQTTIILLSYQCDITYDIPSFL